jgi:hypothetical protein
MQKSYHQGIRLWLSKGSRPGPSRIGRIRSVNNEGKGLDNEVSDMKGIQMQEQLRKTMFEGLEDKVFTLDTFFVQSKEPYGEDGMVFKGNIRKDPSEVQNILQQRIENIISGYKIYLLPDREDKPTAVVIPDRSSEEDSSYKEVILSLFLLLATFGTTLNIYDAEIFNAALLTFNMDLDKISAAIPATFASFLIIIAHEIGHFFASKKLRVDLGPPLLLPAGLGMLGTFGSITNIRSDVQNRETLAKIIAPGPTLGLAFSFAVFIVGLLLTMKQQGGIELDSASFRESFLVGNLSSLLLGDKIFNVESVNCNPLLVVGWGGLIVNSINLIPVGELDGGKLSVAVFGRQWSQVLSLLSFIALGIGSFQNGLALFWLILVLTIQRGPGVPCLEEISTPQISTTTYGLALLLIPLLVLLPCQINN